MTPAEKAWDLLAQAINARDIAVSNAAERVECQFRGVIEMRRGAYMAAIEREKMRPAAVPESCAAGLSSPAPCVASDERGHPVASLCAEQGAGFPNPDGAPTGKAQSIASGVYLVPDLPRPSPDQTSDDHANTMTEQPQCQ